MLLCEPQDSQYDVRFRLFGFDVRVTWLFWVVAAALGYDHAMSWNELFLRSGYSSNMGAILLVWVITTFISILVHELGHALAFRFFGVNSHIVLYQMGGLAIPGAGLLWSRQGSRVRLSHQQSLVITAAGPGIQLLLALIVGLIGLSAGFYVRDFYRIADWIGVELPPSRIPSTIYLYLLVEFLVSNSIWWALINLLPILPLDGGQIARHIIGIFGRRDGQYEAACLGLITACLVAYYLFTTDRAIAALFVGSLAYTNFQIMQAGQRWI